MSCGEEASLLRGFLHTSTNGAICRVASSPSIGKVTLGPKGRNVVLERSYGAPEIVNDGVTIARDIQVEDHEQNVGVKLVQEVAQKSDNR